MITHTQKLLALMILVFNFIACAPLLAASPVITNISLVPRLTIQSDIGTTNQIQYSTNLSQSNWVILTNVVVTQSPYWFVDANAPASSTRFYRVVTLAVGAASAATSTLSAPSTVVSGGTITVTLQARDAAGNNLTAGGAAVTFSVQSGTGTAYIGSATDNGNGTYTATLTGALVGTVTVQAKIGTTTVSSTASVTVI